MCIRNTCKAHGEGAPKKYDTCMLALCRPVGTLHAQGARCGDIPAIVLGWLLAAGRWLAGWLAGGWLAAGLAGWTGWLAAVAHWLAGRSSAGPTADSHISSRYML